MLLPSQGAGLIGSLRAIIQHIFFTAAPRLPKAVTRLSVSIREAGKPSHNKESTTALERNLRAYARHGARCIASHCTLNTHQAAQLPLGAAWPREHFQGELRESTQSRCKIHRRAAGGDVPGRLQDRAHVGVLVLGPADDRGSPCTIQIIASPTSRYRRVSHHSTLLPRRSPRRSCKRRYPTTRRRRRSSTSGRRSSLPLRRTLFASRSRAPAASRSYAGCCCSCGHGSRVSGRRRAVGSSGREPSRRISEPKCVSPLALRRIGVLSLD